MGKRKRKYQASLKPAPEAPQPGASVKRESRAAWNKLGSTTVARTKKMKDCKPPPPWWVRQMNQYFDLNYFMGAERACHDLFKQCGFVRSRKRDSRRGYHLLGVFGGWYK
jgi:hypothetical protein